MESFATDFTATLIQLNEALNSLRQQIAQRGGTISEVTVTKGKKCLRVLSDFPEEIQVDHLSPQGNASYRIRRCDWIDGSILSIK